MALLNETTESSDLGVALGRSPPRFACDNGVIADEVRPGTATGKLERAQDEVRTGMLSPSQVLMIGELSAPAMGPVRDWLRARIEPAGQRIAVDLRSVRRMRDAEGWFPDLIVVCQTWPDQFSGVDIHALLTWFPLSRLVCVYDVWCDSDGRTRNDWPLAVRVPASRAGSRLERELAGLESGQAPLPLTASRGEIFAADYPPAPPVSERVIPGSAGRLVIDTPDAALGRLWSQVFTRQGFVVEVTCTPAWDDSPANVVGVRNEDGKAVARTWPADAEAADVVLFDADPETFRRPEVARAVWPGARLVAAVGFSRPDHLRQLCAAGCDVVIEKLAPLTELLAAVRRAGQTAE